SYLMTKLVEDDSFGSQDWACRLNLNSLKRNMEVVTPMVSSIVQDLESGIELGAKKLIKARDGLAILSDSMHILHKTGEMGDSIAVAQIEEHIRSAFRCPQY